MLPGCWWGVISLSRDMWLAPHLPRAMWTVVALRMAALLVLDVMLIPGQVQAQQAERPGPGAASFDAPMDFHIPAQPLESALNAYGEATRIQIFVDARLVAGVRSAALSGTLTPEMALRTMLAGTGLVARVIDGQGVTLESLPAARPSASNKVSASTARFDRYSGAVQRALRTALCRNAETAPGTYRTIVRFWVDVSGMVTRSELVTSTGDAARDIALSTVLRNLEIGAAPPADLPQPVTLLLASDTHAYCVEGERWPGKAGTGYELAR